MSSSDGFVVAMALAAVTVVTLPMVVLALLLGLRWQFSRVLRYVGSGFALLLLLPGFLVGLTVPRAGVYLTGIVLSLCVVLWAFPLALARWVLVQQGVDADRALRYATVGLPLVVFATLVIYGGRYRPGAEVALAYSAMGLVATFGPTGIGVAVAHIRRRFPVGVSRV